MRSDLPSGTVTFLALGQDRLEELLSKGALLNWEQAVEYALASLD